MSPTVCRICQRPDTLQLNGQPFCREHYQQHVENKIYKTLKRINPCQKVLLFGTLAENIQLLRRMLRKHIEAFVRDVDREIYAAAPREELAELDLPEDRVLVLGAADGYYAALHTIEAYCIANGIPQLIDTSSGEAVARRVVQAVVQCGSFAQAVQLAREMVSYSMDVSQDPLDNLQSGRYRFDNDRRLRLLRPLAFIGQCQINDCMDAHMGTAVVHHAEEELVAHFECINRIGREEVVAGPCCPLCGAVSIRPCCCNVIEMF